MEENMIMKREKENAQLIILILIGLKMLMRV